MIVTIFNSLFEKEPIYKDASVVVKAFAGKGKHQETIEKIRSSEDKEEIQELKKTLPVVLFGGKFKERKKSGLEQSSGILILDFDDGDLSGVRERMEKWESTYACFSSPSGGDRFKALVRIEEVGSDEEYKDFFAFFEEKYPVIDKSGKDISRSSFISYDPNVYINENAKPFTKETMRKYVRPSHQFNNSAKLIDKVYSMITHAPKGEGHQTVLRASYLAGGYIASGQVEEHLIVESLKNAATIRRPKEIQDSFKAIEDTVPIGKQRPLHDLDQIDAVIRATKPKADPKSFIVSRDKIDEQAKTFYEGTGVNSYKTGIEELDYFLSIRPNCFSVFVGGKAAGKTTLKLYINTFLALRHKLKFLVVSFENDPMELQDEVIGFLTGNSASYIYNKNQTVYQRAREFFHEHFTVLNFPPDFRFTDILETAQEINSQSDYYELWIDPIFKVAGTDDYSENKLIARTAEPFANEEMSLFASMHPTGSAQRQGTHVSDLNAEFGGLYSNAADITYAISRFYKDENEEVRNTVNMSIDKVRSKKMLGGMETVKDNPIKWTYDWKKHNYRVWVPGRVIPDEYTMIEDGLLRREEINIFDC
jgi:hypothetical protein